MQLPTLFHTPLVHKTFNVCPWHACYAFQASENSRPSKAAPVNPKNNGAAILLSGFYSIPVKCLRRLKGITCVGMRRWETCFNFVSKSSGINSKNPSFHSTRSFAESFKKFVNKNLENSCPLYNSFLFFYKFHRGYVSIKSVWQYIKHVKCLAINERNSVQNRLPRMACYIVCYKHASISFCTLVASKMLWLTTVVVNITGFKAPHTRPSFPWQLPW